MRGRESTLDRASMDVGSHAETIINEGTDLNTLLESSEQTRLRDIEGQIGTSQVTKMDL